MPHITIEYSANVAEHHQIDALVEAVHTVALDHGLAPLAGLRTRAESRTHYRIADGDPRHGFVAISCRIGPGRSSKKKRSFIERILDAAQRTIDEDRSPLVIAWSIELTEIDPEFRINRNHIRDVLTEPSEEN